MSLNESKRDELTKLAGASSRSIGSVAGGPVHQLFTSVANDTASSKNYTNPFAINATELGDVSQTRTRSSLADLLESYTTNKGAGHDPADPEDPSTTVQVTTSIQRLIQKLRENDSAPKMSKDGEDSANSVAELAALALATVVLRSHPETGISTEEADIQHRIEAFGSNAITEKEMTSYLMLCYEAIQDFVLIMLLILGVVAIVVELTIGENNWYEGVAILLSVFIVVNVTAAIDYSKQIAFKRLSKNLDDSNTKNVLRNGEIVMVTDAQIVVGDILLVNSHSMASIPADCILLGPAMDLKMDESTLTGESLLVSKKAGDVILGGTTAVQGSGKMIVIAVGVNSLGGRIKARVYESADGDDDEELAGDADSPLFIKLEILAKNIGYAGTVAALFVFTISCIIGLGVNNESARVLIDYFMLAITVLAVAVPEGLPLAVTLALAWSSSKMTKDQNLVKNLRACETMGCTTTICTDKTGTLTTNQMTARAMYTQHSNTICEDPAVTLGASVLKNPHMTVNSTLLSEIISICTMNETVLTIEDDKIAGSSGNPTEVALLKLVHEFGNNYRTIREKTRGRTDVGELGEHLHEGKQLTFSSARKMMSWAVPLAQGGYRIYSKGAAEVIVDRSISKLDSNGSVAEIKDKTPMTDVAVQYSRRGMRVIGLAYRDLPKDVDFDAESSTETNSDGTKAFDAETALTFVALVGIEDPLRLEVPGAIRDCYQAGIDVRLVTGDSPNTAVSIAFQAGILRDSHFSSPEKVAANLKPNVLMEGVDFRKKVYETVEGKQTFNQAAFDLIWPHLRVLARSSPDDKLTLAHGLNQSTLFTQKDHREALLKEHGIKLFPDRQVIAMTGDGTNDAPALKRADIGFAMGLTGTQIAKDAADIILLDDNFASIVTAAKWGRNVYASVQKFLQFQLTVNIAAVTIALVGGVVYQESPLAAIQLLWVNLIMDSLASLALASEPPTAELLLRAPVNRSDSMITKRMWANMLGQAGYQIVVCLLLLFVGPQWFDIIPGDEQEENNINSIHYTLIFNVFVWMQLFNEINSRNLKGEVNVFKGIEKNPLFCTIVVVTAGLQVIMIEFGGKALHVSDDGLSAKFWGISIAFGAGSLVVQQIINVLFAYSSKYKGYRRNKRVKKDALMLGNRS